MLNERSDFSYALKCENDVETYPVRTEKNDIIQTSCQHSPIPLCEGNVGPLGCLLLIGKRGLYTFSTLDNFYTSWVTRKSRGTCQWWSFKMVCEMMAIIKRQSEPLSKVYLCSIFVHICLWKQVFLNDPLPRMHFFFKPALADVSLSRNCAAVQRGKKGKTSILLFLSMTEKIQFEVKPGVT